MGIEILLYLGVFSSIVYCGGLIVLAISWNAIPEHTKADAHIRKISVIIAVRNEEEHILELLKSLNQQSYPKDAFEVLISDDHSEDKTVELINQFDSDLNIILLESKQEGKKAALTMAVEQARGELILQTDGDCTVGSEWIKNHSAMYEDADVNFVSGPVSFYDENKLFSKLQTYEFLGLIGIGAACIKLRIPNMCNGANMSYRRQVFSDVDGYQGNSSVASGDDEFLMKKVQKSYPGSLRFLKNERSIVTTHARQNMRDFISQRIRWAGKWNKHKMSSSALIPTGLFVYYLALIGSGLLSIIHPDYVLCFLAMMAVKILAEFIFMRPVLIYFGKKHLLWNLFVIQVIYPFYVFLMALLSFKSGYVWKGRKLS